MLSLVFSIDSLFHTFSRIDPLVHLEDTYLPNFYLVLTLSTPVQTATDPSYLKYIFLIISKI